MLGHKYKKKLRPLAFAQRLRKSNKTPDEGKEDDEESLIPVVSVVQKPL